MPSGTIYNFKIGLAHCCLQFFTAIPDRQKVPSLALLGAHSASVLFLWTQRVHPSPLRLESVMQYSSEYTKMSSGYFRDFFLDFALASTSIQKQFYTTTTSSNCFFFPPPLLLGGNTKYYSRKQWIKTALNGICYHNKELHSLAQKKFVYIACRKGDDGEERLQCKC